ncbi:MAG TPA: type II toxin-antitoxin system VapC family toxin [Intrasporangiaceae bacterium]|nr:type II toxin-antitoxin system VapC family toxin [Intrasporangiaceae bacterium]
MTLVDDNVLLYAVNTDTDHHESWRRWQGWRAEVVSYDVDFSRFPGLRWHRPDDLVRQDP